MKRVCAGLLAFCLLVTCGCAGTGQQPYMHVVDGAYNLTPQEYINLMNQTMDDQEDGDYLTLPNWEDRKTEHTINITISFDITFDLNDDGKIVRIAYHWKNTTEAANTAAFLVGVTISMLSTSSDEANEIAKQLDMFKTGKRSYENTCIMNGSEFYYLSGSYGEHNWFSVDVSE